jgi:X-X-X-Leu-X-X-Gly heptad repeat protein
VVAGAGRVVAGAGRVAAGAGPAVAGGPAAAQRTDRIGSTSSAPASVTSAVSE